jgi:thioredoxin 2
VYARDSFRTSGLCAGRTPERFGVQGIPTMLIMKGKDILARQTGAAPEPVLRDWLAKVLQFPAA